MDSIFRVVITNTSTDEVVLDDNYTGLTLLGDCDDGRAAEVIIHDNVANIAAKLAGGKKTPIAVRFANIMMDAHEKETEGKENALLRAIMGDICDE